MSGNGHLPTTDPLSIHSELTYICQQYPKENIKSGKTDPASILKTRKDDPLVSKMKVKEFLQAIPGIGGAKADKIMHDVDIPGNRRLGGLGIRQAEALLEYLS